MMVVLCRCTLREMLQGNRILFFFFCVKEKMLKYINEMNDQ